MFAEMFEQAQYVPMMHKWSRSFQTTLEPYDEERMSFTFAGSANDMIKVVADLNNIGFVNLFDGPSVFRTGRRYEVMILEGRYTYVVSRDHYNHIVK